MLQPTGYTGAFVRDSFTQTWDEKKREICDEKQTLMSITRRHYIDKMDGGREG